MEVDTHSLNDTLYLSIIDTLPQKKLNDEGYISELTYKMEIKRFRINQS